MHIKLNPQAGIGFDPVARPGDFLQGGAATQFAQFPDQVQTLPDRITVLNWNLRKGHHPQFTGDLMTLLEQQKPHIVFLQEANTELFIPKQMGGYFAESWRYPWPGGASTGVLTLSRVAPVRIEPVPARRGEFGAAAPKVSLVTEYRLADGENLPAVNVHLFNFERWSVKKLRRQLQDLKAIMTRHRGPILMVGDFNTWSRKRLALVAKITREVQLTEVSRFPNGRTTADKKSKFWNYLPGVEKLLPLDRIFTSGLRPLSARVLDYHSSDHRPMLLKLELDR